MNVAIQDLKHDVKVEIVAISSQDLEVWLEGNRIPQGG